MKKLGFIALATASLLAGAAHADPVTWTLSGVTFTDGGTASGSFVYDANTNAYSAINITTTPGALRLTGATYNAVLTQSVASGATGLYAMTAGGSVFGQPIVLLGSPAKTNAGGVLALTGAEADCSSTPCTSTNGATQRGISSGSITGVPATVAAVPTMTEWAMILFGTILAGGAALYLQRRRRSVETDLA